MRHLWRRSLALRVVATTTLLSFAVIFFLGGALITRITDGLLQSKVDAALVEASGAVKQAQTRLDAVDRNDPLAVAAVVDQVVVLLASSGGVAGRNEVALLREPTTSLPPISLDRASNLVLPASISDDLRNAVRTSDRQAWTYLPIRYQTGESEPGLVVGSTITIPGVGPYELYVLFPLTQEQATIDLVRRTLVAVGAALILLIGAITWLVVRQVVRPVRMASKIAERLASGSLQERMQVKGEDDLALLAASFNEMAASLQQQITRLENLSSFQQRFVSDVSHELRNPLMTVRMAADTVHQSSSIFDPAVARSSELLQTQLARFEALLTDLLEISRFDAGVAQLDLEDADLRGIVESAVDGLKPLATGRGSRIELTSSGDDFVAAVDRRRIGRIIRNLVANAIDHGEGKPIEVQITALDESIQVSVVDHGIGIREDQRERVFDRFWRADPARARTSGGTGLGLSIALEDARLHQGELTVTGGTDAGSVFTLKLPRTVHASGALSS